MKKLSALIVGVFFIFSACTKEGTQSVTNNLSPEDTVRRFVELSAGSTSPDDKRKIQALCVGELRRTFERMTDEAFRLLYLDSKLKIVDLKILETTTQADNSKVRYQVTVENRQGTDVTKEINEREVDLVRSQGGWYIDSIRTRGTDQVAFTRGMIF